MGAMAVAGWTAVKTEAARMKTVAVTTAGAATILGPL